MGANIRPDESPSPVSFRPTSIKIAKLCLSPVHRLPYSFFQPSHILRLPATLRPSLRLHAPQHPIRQAYLTEYSSLIADLPGLPRRRTIHSPTTPSPRAHRRSHSHCRFQICQPLQTNHQIPPERGSLYTATDRIFPTSPERRLSLRRMPILICRAVPSCLPQAPLPHRGIGSPSRRGGGFVEAALAALSALGGILILSTLFATYSFVSHQQLVRHGRHKWREVGEFPSAGLAGHCPGMLHSHISRLLMRLTADFQRRRSRAFSFTSSRLVGRVCLS